MKDLKLFHEYKLINKLLIRSVSQDYGKDIVIKLNPNKFILNRTHYCFWLDSIEQVSVTVNYPISLQELNKIEKLIMFNMNIIFKCVEMDDYKEIKKLDLIIRNL
jgi:hypothetical protein